MAKYVVLVNFTDQGVRTAKDTVKRFEQARDAFQKKRVSFDNVYWTLGRHDIVAILDAPDAHAPEVISDYTEHTKKLEAVGRLAGGVVHDFNNLLTVIGASASMAERVLASGSSATDDLNEIHLAVSRGSELTKQLLAFARKQVLVKRSVELNELVSNVERMLRRLVGEGMALSARLSPEPLRVLADAGQAVHA